MHSPAELAHLHALAALIRAHPRALALLQQVASLGLPDCWLAAGFVRNAVWDHLHGRVPQWTDADVDVIWFDHEVVDAAADRALELALTAAGAGVCWSVKHQGRMHLRNDDAPYRSASDAMRYWPETATAVGVRLAPDDRLEIAAPHGLADLFGLVVRPTPRFGAGHPCDKHAIYTARVCDKGWLQRWPRLRPED